MTEALFVANYIIEYCNDHNLEINNLRIQKLLYFINARNLVENGSPLFQDKIENGNLDRLFQKSIMNIKDLERLQLPRMIFLLRFGNSTLR